jgi:hypothetical protein
MIIKERLSVGLRRVRTNIYIPLQGICQDPVRCVGPWILSLNRASGIAAPTPFRSKVSKPSKLRGRKQVERDHNPIYFNPTTHQRHLDAWSFGVIGVRDMRVLRN